jgi:hypothetical protein
VVPNPYKVLGLIPAQKIFFTCLDLKDAFFLHPHRANPSLPSNGKVLVWRKGTIDLDSFATRLQKLTIFETALASNQKSFSADQYGCTLLQYIDGLLLAGPTHKDCMEGISFFSPFYGRQDIKFPKRTLRFARILSNTLGFTHQKDNVDWALRGNRPSVPFWPPKPINKLEFLGAAGFCQIWILNYSLLAKPLYEATKEGEWEPMVYRKEQEKAFKEIKRALTKAPALGLPDVMKPFLLYVHERLGTVVGVLTQLLGPGTTQWRIYQSNLMQFPEVGCLPENPGSHCCFGS